MFLIKSKYGLNGEQGRSESLWYHRTAHLRQNVCTAMLPSVCPGCKNKTMMPASSLCWCLWFAICNMSYMVQMDTDDNFEQNQWHISMGKQITEHLPSKHLTLKYSRICFGGIPSTPKTFAWYQAGCTHRQHCQSSTPWYGSILNI